jgi:DNA (cytosine-5)-methyltransferase 1
MRVGTFCSGICAPEAAWRELGWRPVFFSEIEPFPIAVQRHHFPDVPNLGDMERIDDETLRRHPVDLVCAGTPCQAFSVAGLRKGLDDPRGNLTLVFLRLVDRLRPAWVVWENVPGVLSIDGGRAFGAFLGGLGELGYGFAYRVLDAQHFGVPQRRRRVFVVGHLGDWRRAAAVLFERHSLSGHPAPSREAGQRVAGCLSPGAHPGGFNGQDAFAGQLVGFHETGQGWWSEGPLGLRADPGGMPENVVTHDLRGEGFDACEDGTGRGTPLVPIAFQSVDHGADASHDLSPTLRRHDPMAVLTFDTTQITSAANYSNPKPGDPCHPLAAGAHPPAVAFNWQGGGTQTSLGYDPAAGIVGTLQADQTPAIAFQCHGSNVGEMGTLRKGNGNTAGGVPFITTENSHAQSRRNRKGDGREPNPADGEGNVLRDAGGGDDRSPFAFQTRIARNGRGQPEEVCPTLQGAGAGETSDMRPCVSAPSGVRRLTPRECERLMGFEDDYTLVPFRGKPAADGPRYRAIGNSMAVPVLRWLGQRIQMVHELTEGVPA